MDTPITDAVSRATLGWLAKHLIDLCPTRTIYRRCGALANTLMFPVLLVTALVDAAVFITCDYAQSVAVLLIRKGE